MFFGDFVSIFRHLCIEHMSTWDCLEVCMRNLKNSIFEACLYIVFSSPSSNKGNRLQSCAGNGVPGFGILGTKQIISERPSAVDVKTQYAASWALETETQNEPSDHVHTSTTPSWFLCSDIQRDQRYIMELQKAGVI